MCLSFLFEFSFLKLIFSRYPKIGGAILQFIGAPLPEAEEEHFRYFSDETLVLIYDIIRSFSK